MSQELERGARLGNYELLARVGRGGMASVWVARGTPTPGAPEQLVAVKAMLPELAKNIDFRSMFLDEGQIVRSINHPRVVQVHDVGESDGILYMAMEWVEGDSLHAIIAEANKRRPIPPELAVRVIADTAAGLHAAHELRGWDGQLREIVHCDVSPHNILVGVDGGIKLVDFGVASAMDQLEDEEPGKIRGKFGYMSPEQAQAKPLDRRSDVFSLGIVLFELTTGYRLFRGRNDKHTLELVKWGKIPRPSQVVPDYPAKLEAIVLKTLERDLEARYQTAEELKDALETYLVEERIMVPSAGVSSLLKRVLGGKINERRHGIRAAIKALDGQSANELVSEDSISQNVDSGVGHAELSQPSTDLGSDSGVAQLPSDHSNGAHALSQPRVEIASRSSYGVLVAGALMMVAAGVTFYYSRQTPEAAIHDQITLPAQAGELPKDKGTRAQPAPPSPTPRGVDPNDIPRSLDDLAPADPDQGQVEPRGPTPSTAQPNDSNNGPSEPEAADEPAQETSSEPTPRIKLKNEYELELSEDTSPTRRAADTKSTQEPSTSSGDGIDTNAARSVLGSAASMAGTCRVPGNPTGPGKVMVTIGPSGSVQSVQVVGKFAGTPIGNCVASKFQRVKVPAFSGAPVTLAKGFNIPD